MGFTKDIIGTNESVGGINLFEKVQSTQPATPYTAGLMSATDKSKLDSLENYVHPDSGVVPGKYMQVDVNEQGHVVAGRELQDSTLEDYRIKDAYIDLSDNSIVLGSHRLKPITPSDKVRWEQIVDTPNTLKEFGVTDVALSDGTINIGGDLITPLTADSQIAADKIAGVIDLKNIPVGAMERCVVVEDDTARFALTTNDVQKGDTVKVINPTPTMYMVVDESKLDSADGYVVYSAGNANSVPWSGITDKPDHYYELPPADINTLGGVIVGDNITVDTDGKISTHPPYVLPQATNSTLGGVKIGENLSMQSDGTLSVPNATSTTAGVVKAGNNINIADDGTISTEKYQLPTATNMRLGGVRIGKYLSVDSEGLLNATGVPITASKTDMGGVIIGENIDIDETGKISVTLPTKTSELENDSEFITTENLSLHNNDENAHASKFEAIASKVEAMHGQLVNVYNNVAEMKQSTRLKAGMAVKTLGYYSSNDGGGAYYTIREKADGDVDDGGSVHELASGLIAELIIENGTVNVKQFGAKGDKVTDDTAAIKTALDSAKTVIFPTGTYITSEPLIVNGNTIIGCSSTIKKVGNKTLAGYPSPSVNGNTSFDVNTLDAVIIVMANKNNTVLPTTRETRCRIEELSVTSDSDSETNYGYYFTHGYSSLFIKTNAWGCTYGYRFFSCWVTTLDGCHATNNKYGFWFGQETDSIRGTSIMLNNCYANNNEVYGYKMTYMTYSSFNTCASDGGREAYVLDNCCSTSINSCGSEYVDGPKWHITNSQNITVANNEAYVVRELTDSTGDYSYHIIARNSTVNFKQNDLFLLWGLPAQTRASFSGGSLTFEGNNFSQINIDGVNRNIVNRLHEEVSLNSSQTTTINKTHSIPIINSATYLILFKAKVFKAGVASGIYSKLATFSFYKDEYILDVISEKNNDTAGLILSKALTVSTAISGRTLQVNVTGTINGAGIEYYHSIDVIKL